jgi:hypothetical protein
MLPRPDRPGGATVGGRVRQQGQAGMSAPGGPSPPSEAEFTRAGRQLAVPNLRTANAPRFRQPAERFEGVWPTAVNVASLHPDIADLVGGADAGQQRLGLVRRQLPAHPARGQLGEQPVQPARRLGALGDELFAPVTQQAVGRSP